jgi:hypothetical protein
MAETIDLWLDIIQLVGIPVAIIIFWIKKTEEKRDREYGTYDALDDKYIEYLKLCLQNADLDVADTPRATAAALTPDQTHREQVMFSILIAVLERAFLMYRDKSMRIRRLQWSGWHAYIRNWCRRPNFVSALPQLRDQFDQDFVAYLDAQVAACRGRA